MKTFTQCILLALAWLTLPGLAQAQFTIATNGGAITITGYNAAAGRNAVIPPSTNGYPVIAIAPSAFQESTITNVVIPNSIRSIGNYAFYYCRSLTNVTLPGSVTNVGRLIFNVCLNLTNISVDAGNVYYSSVEGVLFDKLQRTLVEFPCGRGGSYSIPTTVTNVLLGAMSSSRITSVDIPASVSSMESYAFFNCLQLTNLNVNATNPSFTSVNGVLFNKSQVELWQYPSGLGGSYEVPQSVRVILPQSFAYSGITRVLLPANLEYIGYLAFDSCAGLTNIVIPGTATNLGLNAFNACYNLTTAYFLGNAPHDDGVPDNFQTAFYGDPTTIYYLPDTSGWSFWNSTHPTSPAFLWNPQASQPVFTGSEFGFNLTGPSNATIVVEACANLSLPVWQPVATMTFSAGGTSTFADSKVGEYPIRFYRFRSP